MNYIEVISKCINERSFFKFNEHLKNTVKMLPKIEFEFLQNLNQNSE